MIRAWRLVKSRYAANAFDGEGARLYGGRWNSPGTRVAYASESVALGILEVLVHLKSPAILTSYSLASVSFPSELVEELDLDALPPDWRRSPPPPETQALGDQWARTSRTVILRVPSAISTTEFNFLLNVSHPQFAKVVIEAPRAFEFDSRLLPHPITGTPP